MDLKEFSKLVECAATPVDFDKLIREGLLRKIGKSYYTDNVAALPETVRMRVIGVAETKNGHRLTFSRERKGMKNLSEKLKNI